MLLLLAPLPVLSGAVVGPADSMYGFAARIEVGDGQRVCSGSLVAPQWVLTAASCFVDVPETESPAVGPPSHAVQVVVGCTDLTSTVGQVSSVIEVVPHANRETGASFGAAIR